MPEIVSKDRSRNIFGFVAFFFLFVQFGILILFQCHTQEILRIIVRLSEVREGARNLLKYSVSEVNRGVRGAIC